MLSWQRAGDALFCPGSNEAIADRTDNQKLKPATYGGQGQAADSKQVTIRVAKGFSYLLPLSGGQGQNDLQKGEIMATESELLLKAAGVTSAVTIALIEEFEDDRIRSGVCEDLKFCRTLLDKLDTDLRKEEGAVPERHILVGHEDRN